MYNLRSKFSIHTVAFVFFATIATLSAQKQGGGTNAPPNGNVECRMDNGELRNLSPNSQLSSQLSIDGFSHGTNADLIAFSWTTNFSPARAWLEIYGKEFSLTNAWEPRLSMQTQPGETNATVSVATSNQPVAFYTARFDTLRIDAPSCQSYVREDGSRLFFSADGSLTVPVAVGRAERSENYPAPDPAFAANPFVNATGLAYDPQQSTVTASGYGSYDLPDGGTLLLVNQPVVTFGVSHSYPGRTTTCDPATGEYSLKSSYPLDSRALWRSFRRGTSPLTGCSCIPKVDYGNGLVVSMGDAPTRSGAGNGFPDDVETRFTPKDGGVLVELLHFTNVMWSAWCAHDRSPGEDEVEPDDDANDDDEGSECGCGDIDGLEASSLGSVRFRIPLGNPQEDEISGFLYIDRDDLFMPTPSMFQVLARADAHVEDVMENEVRIVSCNDNRGRTLVISHNGTDEEIEIQVRNTADNSLLHTWYVYGDGETTVRFVKVSVLTNIMKAVSYSLDSGVWRETDEISGRTEVRETTYPGTETYMREDLSTLLCETVSRRVVSDYALVGTGPSALLRRTARRELGADGAWKTRTASYWSDAAHEKRHGRIRMESGDDIRWSWRSYDDGGRETFRLEQRDGSQPPADATVWSLENLPSATAFATVFDYEPLAGDSSRSNDWEKARTESRYVVNNGEATLVGRTWTIYEHGFTNVYPVVVATRIRACCANAAIDDPGNETAIEARYDDKSGEVPYSLRGELAWTIDAEGVTTVYEMSVANGTVRTVIRRICGAAESPTRRIEERDLAYGNLVYEAESPTADPTVKFGSRAHIYDEKNRLRSTTYDDGTFETNAYSCCRLLWSQNRDGAKRIRYAQTGTDHLYHAFVDESVRYLPKDGVYQYGPWGASTISKFDTYAPVVDHYFDGLGRETNTVMRTSRFNNDVLRPFGNGDGPSASSSTSYPQGVFDVSETVGFRGLRTLRRAVAAQSEEVTVEEEYEPGETEPSVVVTNVAIRGGGTATWRGDSVKWSCRSRFSEYSADGCRVDYDVVESSDNVVVTNLVSECDFFGRVVRRTTPLAALSYSYDGASQRLRSTLDESSGVATTNIYDDVGELVGTIAGGVASMRFVDYECDSDAWWKVETSFSEAGGVTNLVRTTRTRLTGLSDALRTETVETVDGVVESRTTSAYDAAANTVRTTVTNAAAGVSWSVGKFGYPIEEGSPSHSVANAYGPVGKVFMRTLSIPGEASRRIEEIEVDVLGDETCRTVCDREDLLASPYSEYAYDCRGNRYAVTNAVGDATLMSHDADGNVVSESGATYPAEYAYDTAGRRVALCTTRDGASWDETNWRYDAATGLCTNKVYADGSAVSYTHTPDGLPLRTTYASGRWRENAYDANRRLVCMTHSDGEIDSFAYDSFSNEIVFSNDVAAANLDRNTHGECTNETAVVGSESKTTRRSFDVFGRLTGVDDAIYAYTAEGLLGSVSNAITVVEYAYTPDRLDAGYTLTLSNGVVFTRSLARDVYRRSLVASVANTVNGVTVESIAYAYDALNRPTTRNNDTFGYNERGEVALSNRGVEEDAYAYDGIGNLLFSACNAVTNTYAANGLNQYTSILCASASPREQIYDFDGNMLCDGSLSFTYDAANRLKTVSSNGVLLVTNFYDAKSRRVKKVAPEATTTFFYDGWNLIEERIAYTNGTSSTIRYFWGKDLSGTLHGVGGVGGLLYLTIDDIPYVPCYDNNGNIVRYLDANGNTVAQYTYDAFGRIAAQLGSLANSFCHRFSTKYFESETGLYYYGYRFYSPSLMRWLNRDPIGEEGGGLNLYGFCGNNAIVMIDPVGYGTWAFGIPSPWGNTPDFTVSYELDEKERKCCKGVKVLRYVRKFITGGQIGPYFLDGTPEDFIEGTTIGYAPDDWPEGPGIGWWNKVYYRTSWSWDFMFEAVCTRGGWKGKTLSTSWKLYWADGHKAGETDFKHGFLDRPQWWPDLTLPSMMR